MTAEITLADLDARLRKLENGDSPWIPVSERLPNRSADVLVCTQGQPGSLCIAWFRQENPRENVFADEFRLSFGSEHLTPTHWMPLPAIPMFPL